MRRYTPGLLCPAIITIVLFFVQLMYTRYKICHRPAFVATTQTRLISLLVKMTGYPPSLRLTSHASIAAPFGRHFQAIPPTIPSPQLRCSLQPPRLLVKPTTPRVPRIGRQRSQHLRPQTSSQRHQRHLLQFHPLVQRAACVIFLTT